MVYFDAQLSERASLSLHPLRAHEKNHWRSPLWLLQPGFAALPGERYRVRLTPHPDLTVTRVAASPAATQG
jgi:hypothetical protein